MASLGRRFQSGLERWLGLLVEAAGHNLLGQGLASATGRWHAGPACGEGREQAGVSCLGQLSVQTPLLKNDVMLSVRQVLVRRLLARCQSW